MADVVVENPINTPQPHRKPLSSSVPNVDGLEAASDTDDQYQTFKRLQRQLEYINLQEEYIKDEQRSLKRELVRAQEEIKRIQSVPLVIGQFMEAIDQNTGIVQSSTGSNYVVRILSTLDRELLKPSSSVALHRHSNSLVDILPPESDSTIAMLGVDEKPDISYADVGGLDMQKQEIREAVELPLTHFDLYRQIGMTALHLTMLEETNTSRYRSASRCASIRPARNRQDYAGQGCRKQHHRVLHKGCRLGIRSEIPW